jgi:hypothetical protein
MKTLNPVEHDVIEGRVANLTPAAAPADVGAAAGCGRVAPSALSRRRQADTERHPVSSNVACFEIGADQLVYTSTRFASRHAQDTGRQGRLPSFKLLHDKQREVIWQLRSDVSL